MGRFLGKSARDLNIGSRNLQDYDPEDEPFSNVAQSSNSDDSSVEEEPEAGREHYENVAKSRLRKPEKIELDAQKYGGRPISRTALEDNCVNDPLALESESEEDPFAARGQSASLETDDERPVGFDFKDEDDEIDSDKAFAEGDEERLLAKGFVFRGSGKSSGRSEEINEDEYDNDSDEMDDDDVDVDDRIGGSDEEILSASDDDFDAEMEGLDVDEVDDIGSDDNEDNSSVQSESKLQSASSRTAMDREKLRSLISSDAAAISASLSQAVSVDTKKGKAVKQQHETFDRFLDARIRLQKGLTAANEMRTLSGHYNNEEREIVKKAEEAALRLYSTIESLRHSISAVTMVETEPSSKKRKRPTAATPSTSTEELHNRMKDLESINVPRRRAILDKWSNKTRSMNPSMSTRSRLHGDEPTSQLTTVLDAYLFSSAPKMIEDSTAKPKTSTNDTINTNNEATSHASLPPPPLYQDTQFYQSLLRDLIQTKGYITESSSSTTKQTRINNTNPWSQTPKQHRDVDRKASKGRKVRYTVHEKLENFMAATGRGNNMMINGSSSNNNNNEEGDQNHHYWTDAAVREFFGSLMGMRNQLVEDSDGDDQNKNHNHANQGGLSGGNGLFGAAADEDEVDNDEYYGNGNRREVEALRLFRS